jgi:hypothetical protein
MPLPKKVKALDSENTPPINGYAVDADPMIPGALIGMSRSGIRNSDYLF